jgi:hypothetical protein
MKVFIRNKKSRAYYASPGQWVADPMAAHDFQHAEYAIELAVGENLTDVELILESDHYGPELALPLRVKRRPGPDRPRS